MKRGKRGQTIFGMSFGVIFSIILIIAIVFVSFFAIKKFLDLNECAQAGLYFDDFQKEVSRAWTSDKYSDTFEAAPPSGTEYVCFGNLTILSTGGSADLQQNLNDLRLDKGDNIFLFPPENNCGIDTHFVEHARVINDRFFCVEVVEKVAKVRMKIDTGESLVTLSKT